MTWVRVRRSNWRDHVDCINPERLAWWAKTEKTLGAKRWPARTPDTWQESWATISQEIMSRQNQKVTEHSPKARKRRIRRTIMFYKTRFQILSFVSDADIFKDISVSIRKVRTVTHGSVSIPFFPTSLEYFKVFY